MGCHMLIKEKIPETISSKELQNFFQGHPGLYHLTRSYKKYMEDLSNLRSTQNISEAAIYILLMSAIEIYAKIHVVVLLWVFSKDITKEQKLVWQTLMRHKIKPSGKTEILLSVDPKEAFSHAIRPMIEIITTLANVKSETHKELVNIIDTVCQDNWTTVRYNLQDLPDSSQIERLIQNFGKYKSYLADLGMDVIDRIGE